MKISKWQCSALWICAVGGALWISPARPAMAADTPTNQVLSAEINDHQAKLPQTQRVLELRSADGVVKQTKTETVEWKEAKYGKIVRTTTAKLPQVDGYKTSGDGMVMDYFEQVDIPLTIYHIDYYPTSEAFKQAMTCCNIDLKNERGAIQVRHVFEVPYNETRKVTISAPEGMEFVDPQSSEQTIKGIYRNQQSVLIKATQPKISDPDKRPTLPDDQTKTDEQPKPTDSSTQTDPVQPSVLDTKDESTGSEDLVPQQPITKDEFVQTTNPATKDVSTDTKDLTVITDDNSAERPLEKEQLIKDKLVQTANPVTKDNSTDTEDLTVITNDNSANASLEDKQLTKDELVQTTNPATKEGSTDTKDLTIITNDNSAKAPLEDKQLTTIPNRPFTPGRETNKYPQASPEELATLAKYNRPFKDADHLSKGENENHQKYLPQTGDHVGQLLVALGIALLSILGLFRTRQKH